MKIAFFKNESHFVPRTSHIIENGQWVQPRLRAEPLRKAAVCIGAVAFLLYTWVYAFFMKGDWVWYCLIVLFTLPLHELCHVLFCWMVGRKVERICLYPYGVFVPGKPAAYVHPTFGVWSKMTYSLYVLFPLLLLSVIPGVLALFLPAMRGQLWLLALFNAAASAEDLAYFFSALTLPRNSVHMGEWALPAGDAPVVVHRLTIDAACRAVCHEQFRYADGKLETVIPPAETAAVRQVRAEFAEQFHLEKP